MTPLPQTPPSAEANDGAPLPQRSRLLRALLLAIGVLSLAAAFVLVLYGSRFFAGAELDAQQQASQLESLAQGPARTVAPPINIGAPPQPGEAAPPFLLTDMYGDDVSLADFRGQPVIINFWATWCAPCIFEMPELQAAYEQHQEDGLVVLALNRDQAPQTVGDFLANDLSVALTFPVLLDEHAVVADSYGILNMPTTYFVDSQGRVSAVHRGPLTLEQITTYLDAMS